MYGKLFESMYDGTLIENWEALVTFQQMIILCNSEGVIDMTERVLSSRTGIPLKIISKGIKLLEMEDPGSRTPVENGTRIKRLDSHRKWGWKIVNHAKYRKLQRYEDKKESDKNRISQKRKSEKVNKNNNVAKCRIVSNDVANVADVAHTDTDTDTDADAVGSKDLNLPQTPSFSGRKARKKVFDSGSRELLLANLLWSWKQKNNETAKKPDLLAWAREFDLVLRLDKRSYSQARDLIEACQKDDFWKHNILSPAKFRKHYDQLTSKLVLKSDGPKEGDNKQKGGVNYVYRSDKWIRINENTW